MINVSSQLVQKKNCSPVKVTELLVEGYESAAEGKWQNPQVWKFSARR